MVKNERNKSTFFQWDINQKIHIPDVNVDCVTQVHFSSDSDCADDAFVVVPFVINNIMYANVPNIILQYPGKINVYIYCESGGGLYSEFAGALTVLPRKKPSDYVYSETEVSSLKSMEERIDAVEEDVRALEDRPNGIHIADDGNGNIVIT